MLHSRLSNVCAGRELSFCLSNMISGYLRWCHFTALITIGPLRKATVDESLKIFGQQKVGSLKSTTHTSLRKCRLELIESLPRSS
jgi:hypothetical protein